MILSILFISISYYENFHEHFNHKYVLKNQRCFSNETIKTSCSNYQQSISLFNCIFNSFKCSAHGGALYLSFKENNQVNIIECCKFIRCSSNIGGAIYFVSTNKTNITYNSCVFESNFANLSGGAIYSDYSNSFFNDCQFMDNSVVNKSYTYGGALYSTRSFTYFDSCIFNNNIVETYQSGIAHGGAIYYHSSTLEFLRTNFNNNSVISNANCEGGGIRLDATTGNFSECNFTNNTCYCYGALSSMFESAIDSLSNNLDFYFCSFINNTCENTENSTRASVRGGVLYLGQCKIIKECVFYNNLVFFYGRSSLVQGLMFLPSNSNFSSCHFTNNNFISLGNSSTISIAMMNLFNSNLDSCTFLNNTASSLGYLSIINNGFLSIDSKATILNCLFINNTAFSSSFTSILYSINGFTTENCSFIDNNFLNGTDIYLRISTNSRNLTINNCLFERKNYKASNDGCFIYILNTINNTFPYKFTNNRIIILNTNQFYIFNGNIKNTSKIKWIFENNCLFVYNSNFFKNSSLNLYDETGNNLVLFKDAFNEVCDYPTFLFTESKMFTESQQFSRSIHFSQSFGFTRSIEFTKTAEFSKTNEFSYTSDFSESKEFTKSDEFIPTMEFSRSNINIDQSDYSNSDELSQFDSLYSNEPSQSDAYLTSFSSWYSFNSITFIESVTL